MTTTLVAACANCVSWQQTPDAGHATAANVGFCGRGLAADPGSTLCQQHYEPTHAFKQLIIRTMMREQGPMALPVKLVGGRKSAREQNKKLKKRFG